MRITRRQLRRIILEAITDAPEGGIPVKGGSPTIDYPEAVMISDAKELISALGVTSRYKERPQYIWKDATSGILESGLYLTGDLTKGAGDPYTYRKSGSKYRVISGPDPKVIGKTFSLSPPPSVEVVSPEPELAAKKESVLDMKLDDYYELLDVGQQPVFNRWAVFWRNREMKLRDFMLNSDEIIKTNIEDLRNVAKAVQAGEQPSSSFRAPTVLIPFYAAGPNRKSVEATMEVVRSIIDTPQLREETEALLDKREN